MMRNERIAKWMSSPPLVVPPSMTLSAAQHLMEQRRVRRLIVVEGERLVGIVTWGDLRSAWPSAATTLSVYEWRALLEKATVAECMTRDPITVEPDTGVLEAAQTMLRCKIGALPVLSGGRVVGIVTESDLLRLLVAEASSTE
jgi:CBS domain-containing protein